MRRKREITGVVICMACSTIVEPRGDELRCQCGSTVQPSLFPTERDVPAARRRP